MITNTPSIGITKSWDTVDISTAYKFFYRGVQATGDLTDDSGNTNHAAAEANLTDGNMWATAGKVSSVAGTSTGFAIPAGVLDWDMLSGHSFLMGFTINAAALALNDGIMGQYSAGNGPGVRFLGFTAGGNLRLNIADGIGTDQSSNIPCMDGNDHYVVVGVDGVTKQLYTWVDDTVIDAGVALVNAIAGSTVSANPFVFGSDNNSGASETEAGGWDGIHYLQFDSGGLPGNLAALVSSLTSSSSYPLSKAQAGI